MAITLDIKVIPGAKKNAIKEENGMIKVHLMAPALDGRANEALVEFLAQHYNVRPRHVMIVKGLKSRQKVINIDVS